MTPHRYPHILWDLMSSLTLPYVTGPCIGCCLQVRNVTRDGGFGPWSPWQPCEHLDGDNSGSCLCRARACDSPRPRCGGRDCLGPAIHIANCSRCVRIQGLHSSCLGPEWGIPSRVFALRDGNHFRAARAWTGNLSSGGVSTLM